MLLLSFDEATVNWLLIGLAALGAALILFPAHDAVLVRLLGVVMWGAAILLFDWEGKQ